VGNEYYGGIMSDQETSFSWLIDESNTWPPFGRPKAPFGPTDLEVLRSCPLRRCFEVSGRYERRIGFAARIGTAFHRTLESLFQTPPQASEFAEVAKEAKRRFAQELQKQEDEKAKRPREQRLLIDEARIQRAIEALIVEAQRIVRQAGKDSYDDKSVSQEPLSLEGHKSTDHILEGQVETEVPVKSEDGLLHGRVDYVEHLPEGVRLLDYKSALRTDLPERYERQLQLYALLWHETRGEWPSEAIIVYPFTGLTHRISVDPMTCTSVGEESRRLIAHIQTIRPTERLATPGDVCKVCEFRPWCKPFWQWQAQETVLAMALERAFLGFEGTIAGIETVNEHWRLSINWRDCTVRIATPVERFPQLHQAHVGMRVRALEMRLRGLRYQPQALVTEMSELFVMQEK
jgi:hypothetical protein